MAHALTNHPRLAVALTRPEELALACREALKTLEERGDVGDADRALREIATAFVAVAGPQRATCTAPNCAGHRVRA